MIWALSAADRSTEVTYRYRLLQKSLIVDVQARDPVIDRLVLGRAEPIANAKLFRIPYLTYGGRDPCVLRVNRLFFFEQFDWYVSNASVLLGDAQLGPGWAASSSIRRTATAGQSLPLCWPRWSRWYSSGWWPPAGSAGRRGRCASRPLPAMGLTAATEIVQAPFPTSPLGLPLVPIVLSSAQRLPGPLTEYPMLMLYSFKPTSLR